SSSTVGFARPVLDLGGLPLLNSTLRSVAVLTSLVCGSAAMANPVLKPDKVFTAGQPLTYQPFSVDEFNHANQMSAMKTGAAVVPYTASSVVNLTNGQQVVLGNYIDQINQLEAGFNQMGLSMRTAGANEPLILQETDIPVIGSAT